MRKILKNGTEKSLWQVEAESSGTSSDFRLVIPYLIVSMKNYIGKDSGHMIKTTLYEGDANVVQLTKTN